jgi:TolA-binding protein
MQCSGEPDPSRALEETPGEAVYKLAQEFEQRGDREASEAALRFLIANYPSSRFAEMAKVDLEGRSSAE